MSTSIFFLEALSEVYGEWGRFLTDIALRMKVVKAVHAKQNEEAKIAFDQVQVGEQVPLKALVLEFLGHPKVEIQGEKYVTFLYLSSATQQTVTEENGTTAQLFAEVQVFRNGSNVPARIPALALNFEGRVPVVSDTQASLPSQLYRGRAEIFPSQGQGTHQGHSSMRIDLAGSDTEAATDSVVSDCQEAEAEHSFWRQSDATCSAVSFVANLASQLPATLSLPFVLSSASPDVYLDATENITHSCFTHLHDDADSLPPTSIILPCRCHWQGKGITHIDSFYDHDSVKQV